MSIINVETLFLEGTVRYPIVHKPQPKFSQSGKEEDKKLEYSVQVECTEEQFNKLKKKGISVSTKLRISPDDGKTYLTIRTAAVKTNGEPSTILVIDAFDKPITDLIGNGSTARVAIQLINRSTGASVLRLRTAEYGYGLKVINLIPYVSTKVAPNPDEGELI